MSDFSGINLVQGINIKIETGFLKINFTRIVFGDFFACFFKSNCHSLPEDNSDMTLESQDGFPSLSVTCWQHDRFMQTLVSHDLFSGSVGSEKSENRPFDDQELLVPSSRDDIKAEVMVMIASLEACDLRRTEAHNAGDNLLSSSTNEDSIFEPMRTMTNRRPPKRFHRRGVLWASITQQMLLLARKLPDHT